MVLRLPYIKVAAVKVAVWVDNHQTDTPPEEVIGLEECGVSVHVHRVLVVFPAYGVVRERERETNLDIQPFFLLQSIQL